MKPSANAPVILPDLALEMRECSGPVNLPDGVMAQNNVERYWRKDRSSLVDCRNKLAGVVSYYEDLQFHLSPEDFEAPIPMERPKS